MAKYNKEFIEDVLKEYDKVNMKKAIATKYNIPLTTLCHWINNRNANRCGFHYDNEVKTKVREDYLRGFTMRELAEKYNIIEGTINLWVKNIARKKGVTSKCVNIDYFENTDTESKAYWLGFIMADGNVSITNGQYSLKIHIQYDDRIIIEKLLQDLNCSNKINDKTTLFKPTGKFHKSSYVSITSRKLVEDLMKLGVVPRKTKNEIIPNIDKKFIRHFIRGFFDGDGIVSKNGKNKNGKVKVAVGFISNNSMLKSISNEIMGGWENINHTKHPITEGISTMMSSSFKKILHLYEYLYLDSSIYLERKFIKMKNYLFC